MKAIDACSGMVGCAWGAVDSGSFSHQASFIRYINSVDTPVASQHGKEFMLSKQDKTPWGANGMITLQETDPSLDVILREAHDSGSLQWLRWEMVNGKRAAVYSFKVPITNSLLGVDACCFPTSIQTGRAKIFNPTSAAVVAECEAPPNGAGGAVGNFQTVTVYDKHFKSTVPTTASSSSIRIRES